jgi:hypothetical protein
MLTLDQQIRPHPEVVETELEEGEVVLLHLESKTYYSLNVTGARIWQGVKQGLTLQAISCRLQAEFGVEEAQATGSVLDLVTELLQQHLVQSGG